jgi:hypothetical protein
VIPDANIKQFVVWRKKPLIPWQLLMPEWRASFDPDALQDPSKRHGYFNVWTNHLGTMP